MPDPASATEAYMHRLREKNHAMAGELDKAKSEADALRLDITRREMAHAETIRQMMQDHLGRVAQAHAAGVRLREKNHAMAGELDKAKSEADALRLDITRREMAHAETIRQMMQDHLGRVAQAHAAGVALGREQAAKVKALLARLERMIRNESEDVTYGGFCGGDPREFSCDPECSTEEERAFHATDCAAWDAWEAAGKQGDPPAPSVKHGREIKQLGDGSVMSVKYAGYGLGTCRWVDYDRRALADELAAAIRALGPQEETR